MFILKIAERIREASRTDSGEAIACPRDIEPNDDNDDEDVVYDEADEYDSDNGFEPINGFTINLGTADIPRFACANHKCNIAVRMAIRKHPELSRILTTLSKYAATVKHSLNHVQGHINSKAKLFIDNKTRWFSSYLMLLSFQKSYLRNAFSTELPCPITQQVIETYIKILQPAYQFNLIMQKSDSIIGDVVPVLLIMLSKWGRFRVGAPYKRFCDLLIAAFLKKFDFELNSDVYKVITFLENSSNSFKSFNISTSFLSNTIHRSHRSALYSTPPN